jgi:diguanylate cyclase (GGDEF)-like protein
LPVFPQINPDPVMAISPQGRILYANPASQTLLQRWAIGEGDRLPPAWSATVTEVMSGGQPEEFEAEVGEGMFAFRLVPEPEFDYVHFYAAEATERYQARHRLWFLAYHDSLTHLPNRAHLLQILERHRGRRAGTFALLYLGLDRFKNIVSGLGHDQGDAVLAAVADRLVGLFPRAMVARVYGDEFVVVLTAEDSAAAAEAEVDRLRQAFAQPICAERAPYPLSVSVGIATGPDRQRAPEELLRDAHAAMARAKAAGPGQGRVFDESLREELRERLSLEADLKAALDRGGELVVQYQPIMDLATERVAAFEALVRWDHPSRGRLGPGMFIPVAEEVGVIDRLGWWVLEQAADQAAAWNAERAEPVAVSVNLAPQQVVQADAAERVAAILEAAGCRPEWVKLELTESALSGDEGWTRSILQSLHDLGCTLCIDDFGTGYSALSYVHRFPFDCLKIDKSFIAEARQPGRTRELVAAILAMARSLGLSVIGEGTETGEQVAMLRDMECRLAQGFYYAPALPPTEAEAWLA